VTRQSFMFKSEPAWVRDLRAHREKLAAAVLCDECHRPRVLCDCKLQRFKRAIADERSVSRRCTLCGERADDMKKHDELHCPLR